MICSIQRRQLGQKELHAQFSVFKEKVQRTQWRQGGHRKHRCRRHHEILFEGSGLDPDKVGLQSLPQKSMISGQVHALFPHLCT